MANRRMISKGIFQDDRFTDLPPVPRLLYCYLILEADDDGFITSKKSAMMFAGAKESDLQKLIDNNYIIKFPSGVCVIRHWLQMNKVQETRKTVTNFIDEMAQLKIEKDGSYTLCQQIVNDLSAQSNSGQSNSTQVNLAQSNSGQVGLGQGSTEQVDDTDGHFTEFLKDAKYKKVLDYYRDKICHIRNAKEYTLLNTLLKDYGFDEVIAAIEDMATKGGNSVAYLGKVLESNY